MNIIHILGITILFTTSYSESKIEKVLSRKLQSYQPESKPMWNEVLADVLVNKIKIFSFKKEDKQTESIKEASIENSVITNFFSQVFFVYKKFVYDVFHTPEFPPNNASPTQAPTINPIDIAPEIDEKNREVIYKDTGVIFTDGPKSEVELVEPRYHGKQVLINTTDDGNSESAICPEGTVNKDGHCVVNSRLMLAIPSQCPIGYKRDRLGFCRIIF